MVGTFWGTEVEQQPVVGLGVQLHINGIGLVEARCQLGAVGLMVFQCHGRWAYHGANDVMVFAFYKPMELPRGGSFLTLLSGTGAEFELGGGLAHGFWFTYWVLAFSF